MTPRRFFKIFLSYFLRGLIFTIPLTIIITGVISLFLWVDGLFPTNYYIFGILGIIVGVTLIGYLGSSIFGKPIKKYFNRLLDNAPLLKTVYTALTDFMGTVVGKKKNFNTPVLVRMGEGIDMERIGFITEENLSQIGLSKEKVAVYLPFSYSFSGNLVIVPAANLKRIDARSADVMKFVVSGGVSQLDQQKEGKKRAV